MQLPSLFISLSQSQLIQWFRFSFNKSITLHEKPYFLFPNVLKRWSSQKNRTGIWSFLYYQERYFFFPKIWSYSLDTKGKMIFLKKMSGKMIFSSNVCSERMVFPRNSRLNMIFFVISVKMVFLFFKNYDIFSLGGNWKKIIFIKKRVEIWYFLYICVGVKSMTLSSWQKKTRIPLPRKNTPRVDISGITEKYDVHPGKYGIFAEIPHWLTPEKEPKKQPPEMFCRKRFS